VLFGPGGVVAVLVGAWGAWWAFSRSAGAHPRAHWPAILGLAVAVAALVTWSWLTEPVTRMSDALDHRGDVRQDLARDVPIVFWAGLRALAVGWGLLAAGWFGSRASDAPWVEAPAADRIEQGLALAAAASVLIGVGVVVICAPQFADDDPRTWLAGRDLVQLASWIALPPTWLSLLLVAVNGVRKRLRG
jgi:hypothetical protein